MDIRDWYEYRVLYGGGFSLDEYENYLRLRHPERLK